MKRFVAILILAAMLLTVLCSCGKAFTCALCGEEKRGKQHTKEVLGVEVVYCNDCSKELEEMGKDIEDFGESIGDGISDLGEKLGDLFN